MNRPHKANEQWHVNNRYPVKPTKEQHEIWMAEHAKHCGCKAYPGNGKRKAESEGFDFTDLLDIATDFID